MTDLFEKCYAFMQEPEARSSGYYPYFRAISNCDGPHITIGGRELIMMGSDNFLGLTTHPKIIQAALAAVEEYGTSCSGSRFLNGTLDLHVELEQKLADFLGKEASQIFSTGFTTNQGVISPLIGRGDTVIIDRHVGPSVVEATRLAFGKVRRFRHNDMESLEESLALCPQSHGIMVVVSGVYSLGGDLARLPEIVKLSKNYGARILLDDAHGVGVMGDGGRGTASHFEVTDGVDLILGVFSSALSSLGGFIAGDERVLAYIKHNSRALIFAAAIPPSAVASAQAALEVLRTEPELLERLWENTRFLAGSLKSLGFDIGKSETPIVPIVVGDDVRTMALWKRLFDGGVFTNCVLGPGISSGSQRVRTGVMATHTREDLENVVRTFARVGRELGIID